MVGIAILFNWWFKWRRYPAGLHSAHKPHKRHPYGSDPSHEDIVKALRSLDSFVDVTEEDLVNLSLVIARERRARMMKEARRNHDVESSL
jgi:CBS-domain-containing membrane protein